MKMKSLVCSCALLAGLSGAAQAHEDVDNSGKFTVLFGGGKYFTDSSRDLDDGSVGELGLGYIIDKHWAVEAIYSDISGMDNDNTGADVDGSMFRIDGLYHFDQRGHWTPYLAAGLGELSFDTKGGSDDDELALNFGGGVKYALSKELTARADVRAVYGEEDSDTDVLATIGFNYIFGASAAAPAPQEPAPAPRDSDGDGVIDENDKCPGTAASLAVDSDGCPRMSVESVSIDLEVLFDTNRSIVKPAFMPEVQRVADFMNTYPKATAVIEGHTDNRGEADYNMDLSQRRADAVVAVLADEMDVDRDRLTAKGYGETQPRATNDTADGRQQNRRVTAVISASVEKLIRK